MNNIAEVAEQLKTKTQDQGVVLVKTDMNMDFALENTVKANEEIVEAKQIQKQTGKWLCTVLIVVVILAVVLIFVFFVIPII